MSATELPSNLHIITDIENDAKLVCRRTIHATNGTYAYEAAKIVPTVLAAFQFITDNNRISARHDALLIAVNSDISMGEIAEEKFRKTGQRDIMEDEQTRALKVGVPLALQHPDRDVLVAFYDETTPNAFYDALEEKGMELRSLFKWGYGTAPDAAKIESAEKFAFTFGLPLPNDDKPLCYDITPTAKQNINVVRLTEPVCGVTYISPQGKILFPVKDPALEVYTQAYADKASAAAPAIEAPRPEPKI